MGIFKIISYSLKKTKKINRIAKIISKPFDTDNFLASLNDNSKELALEELLDLCIQDENLKLVIQKYNSNREELKIIHDFFGGMGVSKWAKGHYTSVSAIAYQGSLDYLLRHKKEFLNDYDTRLEMCAKIDMYFQKGEMGFIQD